MNVTYLFCVTNFVFPPVYGQLDCDECLYYKNSSGDEIANVNFFYDDIVHVQASAYAH